VLVDEVLTALAVRAAGFYIDATFGRGGHSARILDALDPTAGSSPSTVIGCHRRGTCALCAGAANPPRASDFAQLAALVRAQGLRPQCDGVLFDFGVSSPQLDDPARGFSFLQDGPIDMRMTRRAANQFPHGSPGRAAMRCAT